MAFIAASSRANKYDLVVIGSGFGSLFFLERALKLRPELKVLILERGQHREHDWQVEHGVNSSIDPQTTFRSESPKHWNFTVGFGGGTNCWFGHAPRLHPNDFRTRALYGVGEDWPVSYDEMEAYYCDAEEIMQVSGPSDMDGVYPRSRPYPQPPHRFSSVDEIMKAAQPDRHFVLPTARARVPAPTRSKCCASARCVLCPANAKFTANNGFRHLFEAVDIVTGARVVTIETEGGLAQRVMFETNGRFETVEAETFVLGANAIHSPAILLASGFDDPLTGIGLNEQLGGEIEVLLDGLDNFDGSTICAGINLSLYDGSFRKEHAGALLYFENRWKHGLRTEPGRWRQTLPITFAVENPPNPVSKISVRGSGTPTVAYAGETEYCQKGFEVARRAIEQVVAPLPVEDVIWRGVRPTESHLHGSLRMGGDRQTSVVDAGQVHHRVRNLAVVGSAVFPTCPAANPSLTVAALSLRAAQRMFGGTA